MVVPCKDHVKGFKVGGLFAAKARSLAKVAVSTESLGISEAKSEEMDLEEVETLLDQFYDMEITPHGQDAGLQVYMLGFLGDQGL